VIDGTNITFSAEDSRAKQEAAYFDQRLQNIHIHETANFNDILQPSDGSAPSPTQALGIWLNRMFAKA
jgi:hypothetical protein